MHGILPHFGPVRAVESCRQEAYIVIKVTRDTHTAQELYTV